MPSITPSAGAIAMIVRRVLAVCFVLAGVIGCLILAGYQSSMEHTLSNGREIDRQFRSVGSAIIQSQANKGRALSRDEIDAIITQNSKGPYEVNFAESASICDQSSAASHRLQRSLYVLSIWRGEWVECYSPTLGVSTVVTSAAELTLFGSAARDEVAIGTFALLCFGLAACLWRRGTLAALASRMS